jgi:hypothetical protein
MQDADYAPDAFASASAPGPAMTMPSASMLPPNASDIVIKNHFPVARIKRIMQADDDVGKVAQVTPVVVCTLAFSAHTARYSTTHADPPQPRPSSSS